MAPIACYQRDRYGGLHVVDCPFAAEDGVVELVDGKCVHFDDYDGTCDLPGGRWDDLITLGAHEDEPED